MLARGPSGTFSPLRLARARQVLWTSPTPLLGLITPSRLRGESIRSPSHSSFARSPLSEGSFDPLLFLREGGNSPPHLIEESKMAKKTNPTPAPEALSTDVTFNFVQRKGAPERLVCEAELVFPATAGILAGLKLVGFSLWKSPEGEIYVTFPARAFGAGNDRRYFDFLRPIECGNGAAKTLKEGIVAAYRAQAASTGPT